MRPWVDVPASTGYGEPVQRLFKFKDNERVVAAFSLDPRAIGDIGRANAGGDDEQATISDADVPVPPVAPGPPGPVGSDPPDPNEADGRSVEVVGKKPGTSTPTEAGPPTATVSTATAPKAAPTTASA